MLGQLTGEDEADSSLNLLGGDGRTLVVGSQLGGLASDALENVVDKRVHDVHALLGNVGLRVALAQDLEDVRAVGLVAGLAAGASRGSGLLGGLSGGLTSGLLFSFGCHCSCVCGLKS